MSEMPERPRPQYGEYAPDYDPDAATTGSGDSPEATPTAESGSQAVPPQLDGVPHNLGISSGGGSSVPTASPATPQQPVSGNDVPRGAPTAGPPPGYTPPPHDVGVHQHAGSPATPQPFGQAPRSGAATRTGDRIFTIVLLAIGALGAINLGLSMRSLGTQLHIIADAAGLDGFVVPPSMIVLQNVGAITVLTVYAITLLWSIQRMRAKKLAFWVPLAGGVLAFIVTMVISLIAVFMVPDLITNVDPEQLMNILQDQMRAPTG